MDADHFCCCTCCCYCCCCFLWVKTASPFSRSPRVVRPCNTGSSFLPLQVLADSPLHELLFSPSLRTRASPFSRPPRVVRPCSTGSSFLLFEVFSDSPLHEFFFFPSLRTRAVRTPSSSPFFSPRTHARKDTSQRCTVDTRKASWSESCPLPDAVRVACCTTSHGSR